MRKINIDSLPKHENGKNKGSIDWGGSIGKTLTFTYNDVHGELTIVDLTKNGRVIVKYDGKTFVIAKESLKRCSLQNVLGIASKEYRYQVGETLKVNSGEVEILLTTRHQDCKGYQVKCCNDGYEWTTTEYNLDKKQGCGVCANKVVVKGINNVGHTHSWVKKYLVHQTDGDIYTHGSKKSIETKCPHCGVAKKQTLDNLTKQGFGCPKCGDGVSIPNKLIYNVLSQTTINFTREYIPEWNMNSRYDFYLIDENIIIEVDGEQHSKRRGSNSIFKPLEYEKENDKYKEQIALDNGVSNYVHIDARYTRLEFIKNSFDSTILSEITKDFDIDWQLAFENSVDSLVKSVCDYYNQHKEMSTNDIAQVFHMSYPTIRSYLIMGVELGWCDYSVEEAKEKRGKHLAQKYGKKVRCVTTGKVYNSQKEASREMLSEHNVQISASQIREVCKGNHSHTKGFVFEYIN